MIKARPLGDKKSGDVKMTSGCCSLEGRVAGLQIMKIMLIIICDPSANNEIIFIIICGPNGSYL